MPARKLADILDALTRARQALTESVGSDIDPRVIGGVFDEIDRVRAAIAPDKSSRVTLTPPSDTPPQPIDESEALRREIERLTAEGRNHALIDAAVWQSPHGIFISDPQGKFVVQNRAAERIWAGSATTDDVEGWGKYRAFHADGRPYASTDWSMYRSLREGVIVNAQETHFQRFDGTHGVLLGSCAPVFDNQQKLIGAVSLFVDITEFKLVERERAQAQDRLRLLAEAGTVLSASLDYEVTLQQLAKLCVPAIADWCAVDVLNAAGTVERVVVQHTDPAKIALAHELEQKYPADPQSRFGVPEVFRSGKPVLMTDLPDELIAASAKDEEHLRILRALGLRSYMIVPLRARSRTVGTLTLVQAESGRRYNETDVKFVEDLALRAAISVDNALLFRDTQAALRQATAEKSAREKMIVELARSNADLDQFAYVASHDLKAPLRGIANLSQWIEEDLAEHISESARKQMLLLRGRVHRMESLIEGILDYSRAGRGREQNQKVDLKELIAEVIEVIAPPATARFVVDVDLPPLHTKLVQIQQVFANLIGNAIKHARRDDATVRISGKEAGDCYHFSVADNGQGIAPEYHARIWGMFQTLESRDKLEGTGIGLAVVKRVVEARGGKVWVESQRKEGATFHFLWPKHEADD